jgi:hypothetical protein
VHALQQGNASGTDSGGTIERGVSDATEVWVGEIYPTATYPDVFSDRPERVVLILVTTSAGLTGTITFGEDPVPPVDPNAYYPPGGDGSLLISPLSGFEYTLVAPRLEAGRLTLGFTPGELWNEWCAGRPSYPTPYGDFACSDGPSPGTCCDYIIAELCLLFHDAVCHCDADGCWANTDMLRLVDLALSGDLLEGQLLRTVTGNFLGEPQSIRLKRVE